MDNIQKLFEAAKDHDLDKLKELEKVMPKFDVTNSKGRNALHFAVQSVSNNLLAVIQFLLEKNLDPLACDEKFKTAIDLAEENKNPAISMMKLYLSKKEKDNQSYL